MPRIDAAHRLYQRMGLGAGQRKNGCAYDTMVTWINLVATP